MLLAALGAAFTAASCPRLVELLLLLPLLPADSRPLSRLKASSARGVPPDGLSNQLLLLLLASAPAEPGVLRPLDFHDVKKLGTCTAGGAPAAAAAAEAGRDDDAFRPPMYAIFGCCSDAAALLLLLLASLLLPPRSILLKPTAALPAPASPAAAAAPDSDDSTMHPSCPLVRLLPVRLMPELPSAPPAGAIRTLPIIWFTTCVMASLARLSRSSSTADFGRCWTPRLKDVTTGR